MVSRLARHGLLLIGSSTILACGGHVAPVAEPAPATRAEPVSRKPDTGVASATSAGSQVALPGATAPASLDLIVCDRAKSRVWVPVGSTGSVDVLDIMTGTFSRVDGFKTAERSFRGNSRLVGPSSADAGAGYVFVGNRASDEVCPLDADTLKLAPCLNIGANPDAVVYVAPTKEVWVTTPKEQAIVVLDASKPDTLKPRANVKLDGAPEGYSLDVDHGRFFTNLEDKDATLAIDVNTRAVTASWKPGCGTEGPRGLAFDKVRNFLVVACTDHLQVLDAAHDGAPLGKLETGAGVDNIDFLERDHLVYAAAGKAARLTVARVGEQGQLTLVGSRDTAPGARNAVVDANGNAYIADSRGARLLVFPAAESLNADH